MAKASFSEWQQNLNWNPANTGGQPGPGNPGARNDRAAYENYAREYDRIAATGNVAHLRELNNIHGFYPGVAGGAEGHHAPAGMHGGGFGPDPMMQSMFMQLMNQYDQLLQQFLNASNEPNASQADGGFGYEDTILTRKVLQDEETDRRMMAPPQRRVIDPATGRTYASPAAALAAGVTSYRYVPVEEVA